MALSKQAAVNYSVISASQHALSNISLFYRELGHLRKLFSCGHATVSDVACELMGQSGGS